jgi:hypothetical protein
MNGQIVDATIVAAPKQRNTIEEKKAIKEGRIPDDWKNRPAKLAQKDRDARWTVKYTKAKPREDGSAPSVDLAIPPQSLTAIAPPAFGPKIMSQSTARTASSVIGRRPTPPHMMARGSRTCWTERTRRAMSGRREPKVPSSAA